MGEGLEVSSRTQVMKALCPRFRALEGGSGGLYWGNRDRAKSLGVPRCPGGVGVGG